MELQSDPLWTEQYERERDRLEAVSEPLAVFHVGSTAIPDLAGKPELDVIAVYENTAAMQAAAETLVDCDERWGRTDSDGCIVVYWREAGEAVYLKLHLPGDDRVHNQLAVRDYLRENAAARKRYERVKHEAADNHDSFTGYQEAKGTVVRELIEDARDRGYFEALPESVDA